jgi:hypothetical protein
MEKRTYHHEFGFMIWLPTLRSELAAAAEREVINCFI